MSVCFENSVWHGSNNGRQGNDTFVGELFMIFDLLILFDNVEFL